MLEFHPQKAGICRARIPGSASLKEQDMKTIKLMEELQKEIEEYQRQKSELISILHYSTNVCRSCYQTLNRPGAKSAEEEKAMAARLRSLIEKNNEILIKYDAYSDPNHPESA
jgi:hypothetical protein